MTAPRNSGLTPLLRAKLRPPVVGTHYVRRSRLLELLDDVANGPLTVVVAPAGAGKTSVVAGWTAERSATPIAWLSLDDGDRDGAQFWSGVIAAMETVKPGCGEVASTLLRRPGPVSDAVGQLLVDLESGDSSPAVLVIDDVHLVDDDDDIADSLAFFEHHLPAWLHLVLVSRRTPKLRLDRLRARGQVGELRFDELRFSPGEAKELLRRLAPSLSEEGVDAATVRADGWAASLQLAALAARSRRAQDALDALSIDDGDLVHDYVLHEVLAAEAPEMVETLLALAVVARVNPSLATALTDRSDVGELLERAERRGLFVTRLGSNGWFGMHSLVRSVLLDELARRSPERLPEQHGRAARWFEETGEVSLALEHLLLAGRQRDALRLLALKHADLYDCGREATVVRVIAGIPAEVAAADIESMLEFAWCHLLVNRRRFLQLVEQATWWSHQSGIDGPLRPRLTMLRSIAATIDGQWLQSGVLARQAMQELGDGWWRDPLGRFGWNMIIREVALSEQWDETRDDVREAELALGRDPERRLSFEGTRALGEAMAGRPLEALRIAAGVHQTAALANMTILRVELATAEAIAHRELGDHSQARAELEALATAPAETMLHCRLLAGLELTQDHLDEGDVDAARHTFEQAQILVETESFGADSRCWLARVGTLVALASGGIEEARHWAAQVHDPFWAAVSAARVHLATDDRSRALAALETAEPRCVRHGVVLALVRSRAVDDGEEALKYAVAAVEQAAAHGILRTVASEGSEVLELVEQAAWRAPASWMDRVRRVAVVERGGSSGRLDTLVDLTDRERDVLRFLPSRLTLREIASELYVSVNTLKFHLKVIYRKLGVSSRAEAAEVARQMTGG